METYIKMSAAFFPYFPYVVLSALYFKAGEQQKLSYKKLYLTHFHK